MTDKKYQTIDPLILETLNLNQKRIHHIFDILHGRDARPETDRILRSATIHNPVSSKLPKLQQQQTKAKVNKLYESQVKKPKKQRNFSASLIDYSPNKQPLQDIKEQTIVAKKQVRKGQKEKQSPVPELPTYSPRQDPTQKRQRLIQDYGMNRIRNSKSLDLNPKDIYRIEIQNLVGKLTQIEDIEDAQKLMKRLKRRYQHLRKFDQHYYSKLNQTQFLFL